MSIIQDSGHFKFEFYNPYLISNSILLKENIPLVGIFHMTKNYENPLKIHENIANSNITARTLKSDFSTYNILEQFGKM